MRHDPSSAAEGERRAGAGGFGARSTGNGPTDRYHRVFQKTGRVEQHWRQRLNSRYNHLFFSVIEQSCGGKARSSTCSHRSGHR